MVEVVDTSGVKINNPKITNIPSKFNLTKPPNPFNPLTNISYDLKEDSYVKSLL